MASSPDGVDLERLRLWMDERGLGEGPLQDVTELTGGTQNILLRFRRAGEQPARGAAKPTAMSTAGVGSASEQPARGAAKPTAMSTYVLRRPPIHKRRNSDETMRREARVLAALAGSDVPHPGLIAAEPDTEVLGAAFYLMEPIDGFNPASGLPEPHRSDPDLRRQMGFSLVDAAAALGRLDHEALGLGDFGRPEGWLERQVERWRSQLAGYDELDGYPGPDIPGVEQVAAWLEANRPASFHPGIIHGDLHFANVLVRPDSAELAAVVDWELCTIGDPLLDLGHLLATWPGQGPGGVGDAITDLPSKAELVARYASQSPRDVADVDWYHVLAAYRLGIILEGTHARACAGKAPKDVGDLLHATTVGLFERALQVIDDAGSPR